MVNTAKKFVLSHPTISIVISSISIGIIFFIISLHINQPYKERFEDLSTGMIIVVLTVLLVDKLREVHRENIIKNPRKEAFERIANTNGGLIISLAFGNKELQKDFAKEYIQAGNRMNKGENKNLYELYDKYAVKLSKVKDEELVKDSTQLHIKSIQKFAESAEEEIIKVRENYDFAFDNNVQIHIANLISRMNEVSAAFKATDIPSETLQELFKNSESKIPVERLLIGIALSRYLKSYSKFLAKYTLKN